VEAGYRHPVELRACPVFDPNGLVLLRGAGHEPWAVDRLPQLGDLRAFARIELRGLEDAPLARATRTATPDDVRVPLRVMPALAPWKNVTATHVGLAQLPLLRRLAYALPHQTIAATRLAVTPRGAFLRASMGIEAIPIGTFYVEVHPGLYVPAGYEVTPAISPDVLYRALGAPEAQVLFVGTDARVLAVEEAAFAPLETALLEAKPWEPLMGEAIEAALEEAPIDLKLTALGLAPLGDVKAAPDTEPPKEP
jgi:hypothetical protein